MFEYHNLTVQEMTARLRHLVVKRQLQEDLQYQAIYTYINHIISFIVTFRQFI